MPKKRKTKKSLRKRFASLFHGISLKTKLLLTLGILLILVPTFFYINEGVQLAFFTPHVVAVKKVLPPPTWISIPAVDIELPVAETALSGSTWQIADNAISHLQISANPGEDGPIILYGHNTNDRFGPIRWLTVGKTITLNIKGNKSYVYTITKIVEVDPSQVNVLTSEKGQTLILYTCSGFADLKRFVVIAKPQ